jgi:hypothetical protein
MSKNLLIVCVLTALCACALAGKVLVPICHLADLKFNLISVSPNAVLAHLNHGDHLTHSCNAERSWDENCADNLGRTCYLAFFVLKPC